MALRIILLFSLLSISLEAYGGQPLSLKGAIRTGLEQNAELASFKAKAEADRDAIRHERFLDNPKFGISQENDMNLMETQMGPMDIWSVSQEIKFPVKYSLMGDVQKAKANTSGQLAINKKLEIRKKILSSYFSLYADDKIIALLQAQRETLKEIARIAEARHATGSVPQQDEMKAHFELTKIENDILLAQEDRTSTESTLNALLNRDPGEPITLPQNDLPTPKIIMTDSQIQQLTHSGANHIRHGQLMLDEAEAEKSLAKWSYAPDFDFTFRKAYANAPADNYFVGVELTFPLWFFEKQTSEVAQANREYDAVEKNYESIMKETHSQVRSLLAKTRTHQSVLEIYDTSLIPQATSALNSSRASYRAGRSTFQDLLDSERSLYAVKVSYFQTLAQYAENIGSLEEMVGASVSTLPFGDDDEK